MPIRARTLWRVPVFCIVASWISYYLTVYLGGFFFAVQTTRADGVIEVSADPLRSVLFSGALFLIVLFAGGLWFFRSMTKKEIAVSAAITSALYLALTLAQMAVPGLSLSLSMILIKIQNWTGTMGNFLYRLTKHLTLSTLLANLSPLLFIPFGK